MEFSDDFDVNSIVEHDFESRSDIIISPFMVA